MKKWLHSIIFTTATVALGLMSFKKNPQLLAFASNYYKVVTAPPKSPAVQYKKLDSSCEATSQYRHDTQRTGVAPESARPSEKLKIIKKIKPFNVDIHNASKSSPTIDETGIYIGTDAGWFYKMNFDGEIIWRFYVPSSGNGIHGSAAVDDKKVYIGAYNGFLYALDKENGDLIWANPTGNFIGASPLLAGGALYISAETRHPDGLVAKLDCNTGETQWVSEWLGGHSHSSPSFDKKNNLILVGANSGRFFAFDADTGATKWKQQLDGQIKGTPMIWDGTVYFGSWDKNYYAYDIKSGKQRWKSFMAGRIQTSLTLVPGESIGVTNTKIGDIIGINLNDGTIAWRLRHGDSNHQFSVLVTKHPTKEGLHLAWSRCKKTKLCVLNAKTGELLNNIALFGTFTSVPSAWNNRLYISLDRNAGFLILE